MRLPAKQVLSDANDTLSITSSLCEAMKHESRSVIVYNKPRLLYPRVAERDYSKQVV